MIFHFNSYTAKQMQNQLFYGANFELKLMFDVIF